MTHARIPDFSRPLPPRSDSARTGASRQAADGRYLNLPHEILPGTIEPWEAIAPVRPDAAHSRVLRFLNVMGEGLTAAILIAGGVFAYGYIPTL